MYSVSERVQSNLVCLCNTIGIRDKCLRNSSCLWVFMYTSCPDQYWSYRWNLHNMNGEHPKEAWLFTSFKNVITTILTILKKSRIFLLIFFRFFFVGWRKFPLCGESFGNKVFFSHSHNQEQRPSSVDSHNCPLL